MTTVKKAVPTAAKSADLTAVLKRLEDLEKENSVLRTKATASSEADVYEVQLVKNGEVILVAPAVPSLTKNGRKSVIVKSWTPMNPTDSYESDAEVHASATFVVQRGDEGQAIAKGI